MTTESQTSAPVLPAALRMGAVELTVTDLDRSVHFYETAIGLVPRGRDGDRATLGTDDEDLLVLVEDPGARRAGRHSGLYHFALLMPSRLELARPGAPPPLTPPPPHAPPPHDPPPAHQRRLRPRPLRGHLPVRSRRQRDRARRRPRPRALGRPARPDHDRRPRAARPRGPDEPGRERGAARARRSGHDRRPRAPARRRHRPRSRLLPRRDRLRGDDAARPGGVRSRRRLSPPPRLQHLARPRRAAGTGRRRR